MIDVDNVLKLDACPCCKSKDIESIGSIQYGKVVYYSSLVINPSARPELWKCNQCESWFTQNRVLEADSIRFYSTGNSWSSENFELSKTDEVLRALSLLIKQDSKVLDVGCANGSLLDFSKLRGAKTFGLEYSEENQSAIKSKGHISYSNWQEVSEKFDIITAFDVVEHLYDFGDFMQLCHTHLAEDGVLVIVTGNIFSRSASKARQRWWYVRFPEHILFPSPKLFSNLENFKLLSTCTTYPFRLPRSPITLFKVLVMSTLLRRGSFMPFPTTSPDHMLFLLKKC
jgi:2-polyprenyl-3-methyl-5-hydroxy-6-metoxy-1,4-benzoquinol methylase